MTTRHGKGFTVTLRGFLVSGSLLLLGTPVLASPPDVYYNTFEYPDMRSTYTWADSYWAGSGPVLMAPGEIPNQPAGLYTGNGGTMAPQSNPPVYVNDPSICRGNWCYRFDAPAGIGGTVGGDTSYFLTLGNPLPSATTEHLFYSGYWKFPAGFTFTLGKFIYMRDFDGTTVILVPSCSSGGVCTTASLFVDITSPSQAVYCNTGQPCTITGDNLWHQFEVEVDPNGGRVGAGTFRVWYDGTLMMEYCPTCAQQITINAPHQGTKGNSYGYYWNGTCCGAAPTPAQSFWIDDIAVSTQRIGSGNPPPTDTTAPSTPTLNPPTVISASQINLAWTASTDPESGVASYNLYRCSGSSTCTPSLLTNVGNVTAYANTGLTGNTLYRYQVSAVNGAGLEGGKSTIQTTATPIAPAFDFALSHGGNRSVPQGSSVTNSITATLVPGASAQSVAFSVSSTLPSGTTASFSPTSCLPDCLSTLTLTTSGTTPTGTWGVTVTGTGGGLSRTTSFTLTVSAPAVGGGIAARYPGDVGIETDPQVVFVERFDDSLSNVSARWSETKNAFNMALDPDVPAGSPSNTRSLRIAGASEGGHLYKNLAAAGQASNDVLYVRYYTKHPLPSNFAHSGVWMGGYHPPTDWPQGGAGTRPVGNDRFVAGAEVIDKSTGWFDHYDYWMGMHADPSGSYWGNDLLNDQNIRVGNNQWVCVEHMVKLNNPVSSLNGEHAIWLNGTKISHLGQGFPRGSWVWDSFIQDPSVATTFEGFQWRNDPTLNINWLWLENFTPSDPSVTLKFDHVVAATASIGCLATSPTCLRGDLDCSGKVDLDDLRRMIYMLVGTVPVDLAKADLDGDGQLLLADLQALVRILVGLP